MDDSQESEHLRKLLEIHRRRLRILEQQRAMHGDPNVPAQIMLQIEEVKEHIADCERQLDNHSPIIDPSARIVRCQPVDGLPNEYRLQTFSGVIRIGASDRREIVAVDPDNRISRLHAEISYMHERFFIQDISRNGTWVNGKRLPREQLIPLPSPAFIGLGRDRRDLHYINERQTADSDDPPERIAAPPIPTMTIDLRFRMVEDQAQLEWSSSEMGQDSVRFALPFSDEELAVILHALDVIQYPNYPRAETTGQGVCFTFAEQEQQMLSRFQLWKDNRVPPDAYKVIGGWLLTCLGIGGQTLFTNVRNMAIAMSRRVRYIYHFSRETILLAALPWELLWDAANNHPILRPCDSLERYIVTNVAIPPMRPIPSSVHALAILPTRGISKELAAKERKARREIWDPLRDEGVLTYDEITPLTLNTLVDYVQSLAQPPDIIHYYGHGTFMNGQGYLLFDAEQDGHTYVSVTQLQQVLGGARLVVIHACESSAVKSVGGLMTGIAPALSLEVGAVVAMQLTVRAKDALDFMSVFYKELLLKQHTVQEAMGRARQKLLTLSDEVSWYVPTLYLRSRDPHPVQIICPKI